MAIATVWPGFEKWQSNFTREECLPSGQMPPEEAFMATLGEVFESCESHVVSFYNPLQDKQSKSTVYVALSHR